MAGCISVRISRRGSLGCWGRVSIATMLKVIRRGMSAMDCTHVCNDVCNDVCNLGYVNVCLQ
jgi:hypothetical protein